MQELPILNLSLSMREVKTKEKYSFLFFPFFSFADVHTSLEL